MSSASHTPRTPDMRFGLPWRACYNTLMRLMREVRCAPGAGQVGAEPGNTSLGSAASDGFVTFWALRAVVEGPVDSSTGFLCNIRHLDRMLSDAVAPALYRAIQGARHTPGAPGSALRDVFPRAAADCPPRVSLQSLELEVAPGMSFTVRTEDSPMICLTRLFEFSAAHRLFREDLSDEENSRLFGKCSNPHGHGHNYTVEVTVRGTPGDIGGTLISPPEFDRVVRQRAVDPLDHKNLNIECVEFASLNPSVENIARVIWNRLHGAFGSCELAGVRVWETPKTYAEYRGEE